MAMFNRILGWLGRTLIAAGVILLMFVGYQLWGTGLDEESHQEDLTREFAATVESSDAGTNTKGTSEQDPSTIAATVAEELSQVDPATAEATAAPREGDPAGLISIPKIGVRNKSYVEGVSKADLRKGPGHYPGTPLPGQAGNASIAGHRTTYGAPFNRIDELVPGDQIEIYTLQGKFIYEVIESPAERRQGAENKNWGKGWFAVNPNDTTVLEQTGENLLTLTACHPKYSAKLRIIVVAKLVAEPAASAPTTVPDLTPAEEKAKVKEQTEDLISGDSNELTPAIAFGAAFLGFWAFIGLIVWLLRRKFPTRTWFPVYLLASPAAIALLWLCFVHLDRFLPSY
jgi:sortase A